MKIAKENVTKKIMRKYMCSSVLHLSKTICI